MYVQFVKLNLIKNKKVYKLVKLVPRYKEILNELEKEGRKIKQADIARHFNTSRETVSGWFNGKFYPEFLTAWELSKFLNRSIHDFYIEVEEE